MGDAVMVAYSFKARFAEPILDGTKGGTIRAARGGRGHARPGEMLQLFTGMRTKYCRRICDRRCFAVEPIVIAFDKRSVFLLNHLLPIDWPDDLNAFARFDGFVSFEEMRAFWRDAEAFAGWHIRWLPLPDFEVEF
jgi:hypothetical protein